MIMFKADSLPAEFGQLDEYDLKTHHKMMMRLLYNTMIEIL